MVGSRDTPPDVQDGPYGWQPGHVSNFDRAVSPAPDSFAPSMAQKLARECFEASTNWINAGRRARWNDSLRAFQSLHPSGSRYLSAGTSYRSNLYQPKTRTMIRKSEAKTAAAFFSNQDVVSIQAENPSDLREVASASLMQALLQYRLTKSIPWFLTLVGARQDADVMGICVAKVYWEYEERFSHVTPKPRMQPDGTLALDIRGEVLTDDYEVYDKVHDRPVVDLISPENIRFEPGCDWRDPVHKSPYIIEMIPMYLSDVREKMDSGEWLDVPESALRSSTDLADDVTRRTRETGRVPGKDDDAWKPREFDIAWVRCNIIKYRGEDWVYYSVGAQAELLTLPAPIGEVFLHGERPYVIGFSVLETHKTYPSGKPELMRDLQRASNDDWNMRFDQLKLALHPRQFVREGAGIDLGDARTFMPGKTVLVKNPQQDIVWDRPPAIPQEAYAEQDRINLAWGDLAGDMQQQDVRSSEMAQQSATGMALMSGEAAGMPEYELRLFATTFVEPLIRLLVKLEQAYEDDPVVLALAGQSAQLVQKMGIDRITDELLERELTCVANVGIGATNPNLKLMNFERIADFLGKMFGPLLLQAINFDEIVKEVMGLAGYKDGGRFFKEGFDPAAAAAQMAQGKQQPQQPQRPPDPTKVQAAQIGGQYRLAEAQVTSEAAQKQAQIELVKAVLAEQAETGRAELQGRHGMAQEIVRGAIRGAQSAARPAPSGPVSAPIPANNGQYTA